MTVREGPVSYDVDPRHGQKTGLFLDQRENRVAAAPVRARARCSTASATTAALPCDSRPWRATWKRWTARPTPSSASRRMRRSNGLSNVRAREANVFDELRRLEREGARFDTIVLDPPAFAKNKASVPKALAGYKEINLRALHLLSPAAISSRAAARTTWTRRRSARCSTRRPWTATRRSRWSKSGCRGAIIPCSSACPRRYYLKCFILRKLA